MRVVYLRRSANGGGSQGESFTADPATAGIGDFLHVSYEDTQFGLYFGGHVPDATTPTVQINVRPTPPMAE